MIKQPLFGQDSSPHKTSTFLSAILTFVLWLVMTIAGAFIKIKPAAPKYKEVQIVLSSEKHDQNQDSSSAAASSSAVPEAASVVPEPVEGPSVEELPVVEETPAVVKPVETTPAPKVEPVKTAPEPKAPSTSSGTPNSKKVNFDDYQYATDYSDGVDFNKVSNKKQEFDWSQFDDTPSDPEPQISQKVDKVTTSSSIQGSAASTSTQKNTAQTSAQSKSSTTTSQSPSSAISSALSNIRNSQYSTSTGNSIKSITEAKTSKGTDGTLSMAMSDGSTRVLIKPVPPVIQLSESSAALIDGTRTVTIEFQVLTSGNVPRAQVTITPESVLPLEVRNEIYDQLSSWVFESSSSSARASFEYTIVKQ